MDPITRRLHTAKTLVDAGIIRPVRPDKLLRIGMALYRFGPTPAAGYSSAAIRNPHDVAIVDELGTVTFEEVHLRTNALAHALSDAGIGEGDGVAIMCRNHRGFVDVTVACSKLGAHALYLNTAFAGPQIEDVVQREGPRAIVFDEEFRGLIGKAGVRRKRFVAWHDEESGDDPTLDELIAAGDPDDVVPPAEPGRVVILTSGTTGTPKGASRSQPETLDPAAALLSRIPLRSRETTMIAAPLFHSWGFAHFTLGMALTSTLVLKRKFDPEATLSLTAQHQATALAVVPVMLQRIVELGPEVIGRYDLSALRVIALSGSALSPSLTEKAREVFGDVLYNLYGSTEVAWATIATPEDLRAAPGTAGRAPRGTIVRLFDDEGNRLGPNEEGTVYMSMQTGDFEYHKDQEKTRSNRIGKFFTVGDIGYLDDDGYLFLRDRKADMIISGGANIYPAEIEGVLLTHPLVADAAVFGIPHADWGEEVKAAVEPAPGAEAGEELAHQILDHCAGRLARFKIPKSVDFVAEMPRDPNGKLYKRKLRDPYWAGRERAI